MFTIFDLIFIVVVLFSSAYAYVSGFVHSIISLGIWFGTAFVTKYLYPMVEPYYAKLFGASSFFSNLASYMTVFILMVMILSFINKAFANKLHQTNFSGADKAFGFLFGLFRGIIIMGMIYIIIIWLMPKKITRPNWIVDARCKPILKLSMMGIASFIPSTDTFKEMKEIIKDDLSGDDIANFEKLQKPMVDALEKDNGSAEMGYKDSEVRDLDRQIQQLDGLNLDEMDKAGESVFDPKSNYTKVNNSMLNEVEVKNKDDKPNTDVNNKDKSKSSGIEIKVNNGSKKSVNINIDTDDVNLLKDMLRNNL